MICPTCKAKTDGVNHNNRGVRCTFCWELLPIPMKKGEYSAADKMQILTSDDVHFNNVMLGKYNATSRAQALAATHGVDLSGITGTGKDGRITVGDVRRAAQ